MNPTRKACDLCYRRKIKCDGSRPRCSHCILHDSECTFTAIKRVARPRNQVPLKQLALQEQVHRLESQLASALEQVERRDAEESRRPKRTYVVDETRSSPPDTLARHESEMPPPSSESLHLPPLEEVIRAVEIFSDNFNWAFPLFHIPTLLRLVHNWYNYPHQRTPVSWAAINVVLAMAHRPGVGESTAAEYLGRAQSAMTAIITDPNPELLSVQVIIGMVVIFHGTIDLQPALILIATAMRLIHRLRMHTRQGLLGMDSVTATQCTRVFWIAYILDKDLSLRSVVPSIQQDDDIDLDFPSDYLLTADASWDPLSANDIVRDNYLRARVQLAKIEGRVYDDMLSARSRTWDVERRTGAALTLVADLEEWKTNLPTPLKLDNVRRLVDTHLLRYTCFLHAASLTCETYIHMTHAHDEQWFNSLNDYARGESTQLTAGWQAPGLVQESRKYMILFDSVPDKDNSFNWIAGCAYFSAMLILLASTVCDPRGPFVEDDGAMVETALQLLEVMIEGGDVGGMRKTLEMSRELNNVGKWKRLLVNGDAEWEPAFSHTFTGY